MIQIRQKSFETNSSSTHCPVTPKADIAEDLRKDIIYNLQEKFDRNQKGFDKALQERLEEMFIKETFQQDPNDFIILGVDLAIEKDKGVNYDL